MEKSFEVEGTMVLKLVKTRFIEAVNCSQYRLTKKLACYNDDVAHELR